nr:reverse transcriptase domain-containing protein [Tanacetum cinerariifolium]
MFEYYEFVASLEREIRYLRTESAYTRSAWGIAMDRIRTLQYQRQDDGDRVTRVIGHVNELRRAREFERQDGPLDTGSSCLIIVIYLAILYNLLSVFGSTQLKMAPKRNSMSAAAIEKLIEQRVTEALATQGNNRNRGNPHINDNNSTGGGECTTCHCMYKDFLNCQPLNFKGTEGAVRLAHWFEKIESVFHINNYTIKCQVKYATCTLLGSALTWWNSHVRTVGHDAAYGMPWKTLMKMMTKKYYPRSEIKKLEIEFWNLTVKGIDVESYTQRF